MKLFMMLMALSTAAIAQPLTSFSVFSTNNITYDRSDFEGNVVASNIKVTDFLFNASDILVANKFEQTRGQIRGTVTSGYGIWLLNTSVQDNHEIVMTADVMKVDMSFVNGYVRTNWLNIPTDTFGNPNSGVKGKKGFSHQAAANLKLKIETVLSEGTAEMIDFSNRCHDLDSRNVDITGQNLVINADDYHYTIVNVTAEDMIKSRKVVINGSGLKNTVVINVSGENINFTDVGFVVKNVNPDNILWNLHEAKTLKIYHSGSVDLYNGRALGFPGTVLAPYAVTKFYEAVITGALWVNDLDGSSSNTSIHGGQINYAPYAGYPCKEPTVVIVKP